MTRWQIHRAGLALMALTACAHPIAEGPGAQVSEVAVHGMTFRVALRGGEVRVTRTNPMWMPQPEAVYAGALAAIAQVTPCPLKRALKGDVAVMVGQLACPVAG